MVMTIQPAEHQHVVPEHYRAIRYAEERKLGKLKKRLQQIMQETRERKTQLRPVEK